jgi:hypothetical protein
MHDANGNFLTVGQSVTVTGIVTKVDETSVSLDVAPVPGLKHAKPATLSLHPAQVLPEGASKSDYVFQEYPKSTEAGLALSKEHEAELRAAPKVASDAAKKEADAKAAADTKAADEAKK